VKGLSKFWGPGFSATYQEGEGYILRVRREDGVFEHETPFVDWRDALAMGRASADDSVAIEWWEDDED